jgi:lysophospholipase L1-like esterase
MTHSLPKIVALVGLLLLGLGLAPPDAITVYMIGDSTMSEKEVEAYPETGWGTPFAVFFDESVTVENHARNGRSTRTFLEEGRWQPVVENLEAGDYVFIQFGHNDEVPSKEQYTTEENFKANLTKFVAETREKGGMPILLTPVARRHFADDGTLEKTHPYARLTRTVAKAHDVALIDHTKKSKALLRELGSEDSKFLYNHLEPGQHPNYPQGREDDTHFNNYGARRMAELVLDGIQELDLDLATRVVNRDDG